MKKIKLRALRKLKKISQMDMAVYLKISQTQYQKREAGKILISEKEWIKIAKFLEVDVSEIKEEETKTDLVVKQYQEVIKKQSAKITDLEQEIRSIKETV